MGPVASEETSFEKVDDAEDIHGARTSYKLPWSFAAGELKIKRPLVFNALFQVSLFLVPQF